MRTYKNLSDLRLGSSFEGSALRSCTLHGYIGLKLSPSPIHKDLGALIVTVDGFSKDRAVYFESKRKVALRIFTEVQQLATKLDSKKLCMTEFTEMNFLIFLGDNLRHVYQNIY